MYKMLNKEVKKMDVKIENGTLINSIDPQELTPSASGKTLVVATTHSNMSKQCVIHEKNVVIRLNVYK